MVPELGIEDMSLQKLYANLFHQKISKRQRLSNWESPILDDKQKQYASIDAWACIRIYDEIERLKQTGDYRLVVIPDDGKPQPEALPVGAATSEEGNGRAHRSSRRAAASNKGKY